MRDLTELFTAATVTHGDLPSPADLGRADVVAFERNGGSPSAGGAGKAATGPSPTAPSPAPGQEATPDIDTIGVIRRAE